MFSMYLWNWIPIIYMKAQPIHKHICTYFAVPISMQENGPKKTKQRNKLLLSMIFFFSFVFVTNPALNLKQKNKLERVNVLEKD